MTIFLAWVGGIALLVVGLLAAAVVRVAISERRP